MPLGIVLTGSNPNARVMFFSSSYLSLVISRFYCVYGQGFQRIVSAPTSPKFPDEDAGVDDENSVKSPPVTRFNHVSSEDSTKGQAISSYPSESLAYSLASPAANGILGERQLSMLSPWSGDSTFQSASDLRRHFAFNSSGETQISAS
jgi:hypothetical protein